MDNTDQKNTVPAVPGEKTPELSAPEINAAAEQRENPDTFEQTKEILTIQADEKLGELKKSGDSFEHDIEKNGGSDDDIKKFEEGEQKIEEKAGIAKEEYKNSFVTPGVIESQIAEKKSEMSEVDIPEQKSCSKCGHVSKEGDVFCRECGSGLSKPDDLRKTGQKEIPNFSDKEKSFKLEHYKVMTDEYAGKYPETVANMREIAGKAGFKNIFIVKTGQKSIIDDRNIDSIYVEASNYGKNAVFFPEEYLQNHILVEKLDKDLADLGLRMVLLHEKEHCEDAAKKAGQVGTFIETDEEYQDHIAKYAGEKGLTDEEAKKRIERITRRNEMFTESQTNTQVVFKNPEEFEKERDVVKKIVACEAYMDALTRGIEGMRQGLSTDERYFAESVRHYDIGYRTFSDNMLSRIIMTQKKMEEKLIRDYDEKYGKKEEGAK